MGKTFIISGVLILILIIGFLYFYQKPSRENTETGNNNNVEREEVVENEGTQTITLYYYDENKDKDSSGNIMCSDKGLVPVERTIPQSNTPIQDAVEELLKGEISSSERTQGVTTEFPLNGVGLVGANLAGGVLTLEFSDPNNSTGGGSCRVSILRAQIEKTVMEFDGVERVVFKPDEVFQP